MTTTTETIAELKRCKQRVSPKGQWGAFHQYQCHRNSVRDGFCTQHHPDTVKARSEAADVAFRLKMDRKAAPFVALSESKVKIEKLEQDVKVLREALRSILMQPMANEWSREQARAALAATGLPAES